MVTTRLLREDSYAGGRLDPRRGDKRTRQRRLDNHGRPYTIEYEEVLVFADLAADRLLAFEREDDKIVVEIKSFLSRSPIRELETALGQYSLYLGFMEVTAPDRKLYLAVSGDTYTDVFQQKAIQLIVDRFQLALIVVNLQSEEIVKWIS